MFKQHLQQHLRYPLKTRPKHRFPVFFGRLPGALSPRETRRGLQGAVGRTGTFHDPPPRSRWSSGHPPGLRAHHCPGHRLLNTVFRPHSAPAGSPPHGEAGLCSLARRVDTPPHPGLCSFARRVDAPPHSGMVFRAPPSGLIPHRRVHHRTGRRASVLSPNGWIHHRLGQGPLASFRTGGYTTARGGGPLFFRPAGGYTTALGRVCWPHSAPAGTPPHGGAGLCSFAQRVDAPPHSGMVFRAPPSGLIPHRRVHHRTGRRASVLSPGGWIHHCPGHALPASFRTGGYTTAPGSVGCYSPPVPFRRQGSSTLSARGAWRTPRTVESGCQPHGGISESVLSAAPRYGRPCFVQSFPSSHSFSASRVSGKQSPGRVPGRGCHPRPSRPGVHGVCTYPEAGCESGFRPTSESGRLVLNTAVPMVLIPGGNHLPGEIPSISSRPGRVLRPASFRSAAPWTARLRLRARDPASPRYGNAGFSPKARDVALPQPRKRRPPTVRSLLTTEAGTARCGGSGWPGPASPSRIRT